MKKKSSFMSDQSLPKRVLYFRLSTYFYFYYYFFFIAISIIDFDFRLEWRLEWAIDGRIKKCYWYGIRKGGKILYFRVSHPIPLYWQFQKTVHTKYDGSRANMPPSSSGSGHLSFKEAAGIRLPLGVGYYERKLIVDYK